MGFPLQGKPRHPSAQTEDRQELPPMKRDDAYDCHERDDFKKAMNELLNRHHVSLCNGVGHIEICGCLVRHEHDYHYQNEQRVYLKKQARQKTKADFTKHNCVDRGLAEPACPLDIASFMAHPIGVPSNIPNRQGEIEEN